MNLEDVQTIIVSHEDELRRRHVAGLYVFGSVARGEAHAESDIDLLVEFDVRPTYDLYLDMKDFLEAILGKPVDLVTAKSVRPRLWPFIDRDLLRVA